MIEFFRRVFVFVTHYLRTLSFLCKVANILLDLLNFLNFAISDFKKNDPLNPLPRLPFKQRPSDRPRKVTEEKGRSLCSYAGCP